MISSLLLRVSAAVLLLGMCFGIAMGISQDFTLAAAHAHLNLVGFVVPFLAGLYYRSVPTAATGMLATVQAWLAVIGGLLFPAGIALVLGVDHKFEPVAIVGSLVVLVSAALFAFIVFRTSAARTA